MLQHSAESSGKITSCFSALSEGTQTPLVHHTMVKSSATSQLRMPSGNEPPSSPRYSVISQPRWL